MRLKTKIRKKWLSVLCTVVFLLNILFIANVTILPKVGAATSNDGVVKIDTSTLIGTNHAHCWYRDRLDTALRGIRHGV